MNWEEITVGSRSEPGPVRASNEDNHLADEVPGRPGASSARAFLAAVADGAGGHSKGDVASRLALSSLRSSLATASASPEQALQDAFAAANRAVYERAQADASDMCTTLTAALITDRGVWIAHVGDTRLYLLRDGRVRQITQDDTWVGEQLRRGALREEVAREMPQRHLLTMAVGTSPRLAIQPTYLDIEPGDRLLLCSDGIHSAVDEAEIAAASRRAPAPQPFTDALTRLAEANDGSDNMTAVVVQFGAVPAPPPTRRLDISPLVSASRKKRRARLALKMIAVALLLAAGAYWWLSVRQREPRPVSAGPPPVSREGGSRAGRTRDSSGREKGQRSVPQPNAAPQDPAKARAEKASPAAPPTSLAQTAPSPGGRPGEAAEPPANTSTGKVKVTGGPKSQAEPADSGEEKRGSPTLETPSEDKTDGPDSPSPESHPAPPATETEEQP